VAGRSSIIDKTWDADTLSRIAEVVAKYIPKPPRRGQSI